MAGIELTFSIVMVLDLSLQVVIEVQRFVYNRASTVSRLFLHQLGYHYRDLHAAPQNKRILGRAFDSFDTWHTLMVAMPWAEAAAALTTTHCSTSELFHIQVLDFGG